MLNQQPNRTSKLISDCFEDRGPLVYLDFIMLLKPFGFFHSEQLVWSGYISDSNNMSFFLFLVMSSDVQRIILLSCISLFLC